MTKRKGKTRDSKVLKIVLPLVAIVLIGFAGWWIWGRDTKQPEPASQPSPTEVTTPKVCASDARICLETDWPAFKGSIANDDFFMLSDGKALLTFYGDTSGAKPDRGCVGSCSMIIVSAQPMKQLKNTLLVRAVFQQSGYDVIQSYIFLVSTDNYSQQGFAVGKTVSVGYDNPSPVFLNVVGGKTNQAQLVAQNYKPGMFSSVAAARKWLDSKSALAAQEAIQNLKVTSKK